MPISFHIFVKTHEIKKCYVTFFKAYNYSMFEEESKKSMLKS